MKASWTNRHSTGIDSLTRYTGAGAYSKTLAKTDTSETITGLTPNTQYIFKARVDSGGTFGYSNADTLYTLANPPAAWAFTEDYNDSTKVTIGFDVNSNPAATEFAIRDSVAQKWVGSDGIADESARVWRTKAQWNATASVINRDPAKLNRLGVVARNGDGIETAYIWGTVTTGNVRIVVVNADSMRTHRAISSNYTTAHDQTAANSIFTTVADTIGQNKRGSDYLLWRMSLRYQLPAMDAALACTVFTTGSKDSSLTDFNVTARPGNWLNGPMSSRYWNFFVSGGLPNHINTWSSASYGVTNHWIYNAEGIAYLNWELTSSGVLQYNFISARDSSATAPSGAEYIVITNPVIHLRYIKYDAAPTNVVVTAIAPDSVLVTWTDNTINEAGFYLVNAYTGARIGGNDSTAANATSKRYGGLSPNTKYNIALQVKGGKIDGTVSTASDSTYTWANVPGAPTVSYPTDSLMLIKLNVNGNPAHTEFAIQDSLSGLFFDGRYNRFFSTTAAESILWRTYAAWGGASGDTVAVGVGKKYVFRAKARSGE
ncbi:MAG TPA: fibronectin type III domain-containing protein [Candidatus Latescibacteria bacterium]|nr:fibronectin type III domain-containing protein [Candidatus Latescibacterota bacterium]